jgi:UPF0042 nucleotide-binding protein
MSVRERPELVVITGMSGAGRSTAARALEDLGFFVIDNLPVDLIGRVVQQEDLAESTEPRRLAVSVDVRGGLSFEDLEQVLLTLAIDGVPTTMLFLTADDETLARRYEESRRPHPIDAPTVIESIRRERQVIESLHDEADIVIDTTDLSVHELRDAVTEAFAGDRPQRRMKVTVSSFGFKHGVPRVVNLLLDVRFLPNPHWIQALRPQTGRDPAVRDFVLSHHDTAAFLERTKDLLAFLIPRYEAEGKSYFTVGIGCTGGRHRSVALAETLGGWLGEEGFDVVVSHRDVEA